MTISEIQFCLLLIGRSCGNLKGLTVVYCKKRIAAQREKRYLLSNIVNHLTRKNDIMDLFYVLI